MINNSKIFKFNDLADYIFYLSEIIIDLIQKKERLEKCRNNISEIIRLNPSSNCIDSVFYDSISDRANRLIQYISNLIGDESKKAVSYKKFRKLLYKQRTLLEITIDDLSSEEKQSLGEFNTLRNWSLHIPESIFIQKKDFFKMDSKFIMSEQCTITVPTYDNFELEFLIKMKDELNDFLSETDIIFERMKKDYSALIGKPFTIKYESNIVKPYFFMEAVEKSWNVQKGK